MQITDINLKVLVFVYILRNFYWLFLFIKGTLKKFNNFGNATNLNCKKIRAFRALTNDYSFHLGKSYLWALRQTY